MNYFYRHFKPTFFLGISQLYLILSKFICIDNVETAFHVPVYTKCSFIFVLSNSHFKQSHHDQIKLEVNLPHNIFSNLPHNIFSNLPHNIFSNLPHNIFSRKASP